MVYRGKYCWANSHDDGILKKLTIVILNSDSSVSLYAYNTTCRARKRHLKTLRFFQYIVVQNLYLLCSANLIRLEAYYLIDANVVTAGYCIYIGGRHN